MSLKSIRQSVIHRVVVAAQVTLIAVLMNGITALAQPAAASERARFDDQESYVADGQTIQVQRIPDEVTVRFVDAAEAPLETANRWSRTTGHALEAVRKLAGRAVLGRLPAANEVDAGNRTLEALQADATVRYVFPVYRLANGKRLFLNDEIMVRLRGGPEIAQLAAFQEMGLQQGETLSVSGHIHRLRLTEPKGANPFKVCAALRARAEVMWAEPNLSFEIERHATTPNDSLFTYQWHHKNTGTSPQTPSVADADIDSDDAWDSGYGSPGIRIAILDDGVQTTHPDLDDNLVAGYDFFDDDSDPNPSVADDNHGTAVAGVAAAEANNSTGIAGVAGKSKLLPVKIFEDGVVTTVANVYRALAYAADNADVINCSWGGGSASSTITAGFSYAYSYGRAGKGCVVLCSSGNSASGDGQFSYDHLEFYDIYSAIGAGKY